MKTLRIAHISDLHLNAKHARVNIRNTRRLLDHASRLNIDHLVVTGDISANADEDDFLVARSLFHSAGLLDSQKMSVVIGNHDVYGGVYTAEDILQFPRRCRKVDVTRRMKRFCEHFQELFRTACCPNEGSCFPYLKPVGDLLLIGLNSVAEYSRVKNPVGSNGLVDERQQKQLDKMLASAEFRRSRNIVLIHHHFNKMEHATNGTMEGVWKAFEQQTMKLRGKKTLMELFKKHHVDAVLHGHYHENTEYTRKGLQFINGGASVQGSNPLILRLNVLHISSQEVRVEHHEIPSFDEMSKIRPLRQAPTPSHVAA
jgi:3',5'-cyclic AMP phosphodiesterase CpdA